jgi:hypothetical protein
MSCAELAKSLMARIAESRQAICLRVGGMLRGTGVQCEDVIGTMTLRAGERKGWLWQTWHDGDGSFHNDEAALVKAAQWEIVGLRRDRGRYAARHRPLTEGEEPPGVPVSADPAELWEEARGHRAEILAAAGPAGLTALELFLVTAVLDDADADDYEAVDAVLLARIVAQGEAAPDARRLAQRRRAILSRAAGKLRDHFAGGPEGGRDGA